MKKILMYEFQHDYEKSKYVEKENLCYMDTDSFIAYLKTDDIYKDIGEDVETGFDIQIMNQIDHCPKEKKRNWINQR